MGLETHCPGTVSVQVKQATPGIGENRRPVITGDLSEEQSHGDSDHCRLDPLPGLVCMTGEVAGLGPRGGRIPSYLVPVQFRIPAWKRGFQCLGQACGRNEFAF